MRKLYVIGVGPGAPEECTLRAQKALEEAEVLCGYTLYINLLRSRYPEKEAFTTGMTQELERCRRALELAASGRTVALVCSGDAGVYGLASPVLELAPQFPEAEIEIIPGVTAALSGASLLGAPLGHDFCVISLSDRLTPWSVIEKRLLCAAEGDFVLCLYNPASRHRKDSLRRASELLLSVRPAGTLCALVQNIAREGQSLRLLPLGELPSASADMFTTVFIGSSQTKAVNGRMVTPRGYGA